MAQAALDHLFIF
jgi:hypothetical protein